MKIKLVAPSLSIIFPFLLLLLPSSILSLSVVLNQSFQHGMLDGVVCCKGLVHFCDACMRSKLAKESFVHRVFAFVVHARLSEEETVEAIEQEEDCEVEER
jgi:hypothetical protein